MKNKHKPAASSQQPAASSQQPAASSQQRKALAASKGSSVSNKSAALKPLEQAIFNYLEEFDSAHDVVQIDIENQEIRYHPDIICHQKPKYEYEGFVRAYLVTHLVKKLNYPRDCIELENDLSVKVGRTKKHRGIDRGRSDILVFQREEGKEALFLAIECKIPEEWESAEKDIDGQLWGITKAETIEARVGKAVKYLVLYACKLAGGEIHDQIDLVDFQDFRTYKEWKDANSPSGNALPAQYEDAPQSAYAKVAETIGNLKPLNTKYSREDFVKLRRNLHNLLWAGSSTDDNAIFYQLVKIFLVKIYDELYTNPGDPYELQIRTQKKGEESAEELFTRLDKLYATACRMLLNYDDEKLADFPFKVEGFTVQKLKVAVKELQGVSLTENKSTVAGYDILGAFFEGILTNQDFFKQSKGCFFTHHNIVRFMIAMLGLDDMALELIQEKRPRLPAIIDPSCGSGTFLIEAMKFVSSRVRARNKEIKFNRVVEEFYASRFEHKTKPNIWAADYIYGIEPRPELGLAAKVNMILHGDGNMNIFIEDGLQPFSFKGYSRRWKDKNEGVLAVEEKSHVYEGKYENEQFDVVITNPPFSLQTDGLDSYSTHKHSFLYHDYANSENLFLERHYQLLREGGKLAAVLPESVFDTSENKYIRNFLYRYFKIDAVVSLTQEAFAPFTSTKTSLLFATKRSKSEVAAYDNAWMRATKVYGKLRKTPVIQTIIENDRLMNSKSGLIKLASDLQVEFLPEKNLLDGSVLTPSFYKTLKDAIEVMPSVSTPEKKAKVEKETRLNAISGFVTKKIFDGLDKTATLKTLEDFLRNYYPSHLTNPLEICERAYDELVEISKIDWPDFGDQERYANAWWCFSVVSSDDTINYPVFFAEAENLGYKRTKRSETARSNELYQAPHDDGFPVPNMKNPTTILDKYWNFKMGLKK